MVGCLEKTCCCLWSVIMGLLRLFLFLLAFAILISQLILVATLTYIYLQDPEIKLYLPKLTYENFIPPVGLVILLLFGCHSVASNNKRRLQLFALVAAIAGVVLLAIQLNPNISDSISTKEISRLVDNLKKLEAQYDWTQDWPTESTPNKIIDFIQTQGQCCGIDGPTDWDQLKPKNQAKYSYPDSCCGPIYEYQSVMPGDNSKLRKLTCNRDYIFKHDCRDRIKNIMNFRYGLQLSVGVLLVILASASLFVGCLQCQRGSVQSTQLVTVTTTRQPTINSEPARFHYNDTRAQPIYQEPYANLRAPLMYPEPPSYVDESRNYYSKRV